MTFKFLSFSRCIALTITFSVTVLSGCATESHVVLQPQTVASKATAASYQGIKHTLVVGNFQNRSSYQKGLFSSGSDRLGSQAKTILKTHLQQTGRFTVLDRANMQEIAAELKLAGKQQNLTAAQFIITGDVTEFGRKVTGDHQLFGILGEGKTQTAYAKVALNIVNIDTSEIIYSAQGAAEYALSNREVIGFGGTAGYDSTLNEKVLNLAITEAIEKLVAGIEGGQWSL
jgi:curli biogenesis system outer membrane secretion channel CsgG